jgi:hypothetical protein
MQGFITGRHVVLYSLTIIRDFGPRCWLRCVSALFSSHPTTFLAVACVLPSRSKR